MYMFGDFLDDCFRAWVSDGRTSKFERHIAEPGGRPETPTHHHIITLASGSKAAYAERPGRDGRLVPYAKLPGAINVDPEGVVPAVYPSTQTELTVCVLAPAFLEGLACEQEPHITAALRGRMAFRDEPAAGLIRLMEEEAKSGGMSGRSCYRFFQSRSAFAGVSAGPRSDAE
jgi:AraC family transcriptional regulator